MKCGRCGVGQIPRKGSRGRAGAARNAGLCVKCWQGMGSVTRFLEEAAAELQVLTQDLADESGTLVERARRFVHELRGRVVEIKGSMRRMEGAIREANAEVRRQGRDVGTLWPNLEETSSEMPHVPRSGKPEEKVRKEEER